MADEHDARQLSVEPEHGHQRFVDRPHFIGGQMTNAAAETSDIECTNLFYKDPCLLSKNGDFRAK